MRPEALVDVAWRAETGYVGVRCGRMDQTIAVFGRPGKALEFDTATGARRMVPFPGTVRMIDSGLRHALVAGEYEHRRIECEEALRRCQRLMPDATSLAAIPVRALPRIGRELPKTLARRVRHVVTETARVHEAVSALGRGRIAHVRPVCCLPGTSHCVATSNRRVTRRTPSCRSRARRERPVRA